MMADDIKYKTETIISPKMDTLCAPFVSYFFIIA